MLDKEYLNSLIDYDPKTGKFTWKIVRVKNQLSEGSHAGYIDSKGYLRIQIDGKNYMAHKLAWLSVYGTIPETIDHINQVKNDNRIENLRVVTHSENAKNKKIGAKNTSGCMGVTWKKSECRWVVRINADGKRVYLGSFAKYDDAVNARKSAEKLYGYHTNHNKVAQQ